MSLVDEIEAAIEGLAYEDFQLFARRVHECDQQLWDDQLDRDSASGKLDFPFEEAAGEAEAGALREWPSR